MNNKPVASLSGTGITRCSAWVHLGNIDYRDRLLEISIRGHEYEKVYRIKNVVTFFRRQFPGKQQWWCQIWHPKSGIHVPRICVESLVQIGTNLFLNFDLWPSMTMTFGTTSRINYYSWLARHVAAGTTCRVVLSLDEIYPCHLGITKRRIEAVILIIIH
jgi:hypothetical protein